MLRCEGSQDGIPLHRYQFLPEAFIKRRREISTVRGQFSLVFQNIGSPPPSPSPPGECVPPAFVGREDTLARRRRGMGVNILEDERDRIALLQKIISLRLKISINEIRVSESGVDRHASLVTI